MQKTQAGLSSARSDSAVSQFLGRPAPPHHTRPHWHSTFRQHSEGSSTNYSGNDDPSAHKQTMHGFRAIAWSPVLLLYGLRLLRLMVLPCATSLLQEHAVGLRGKRHIATFHSKYTTEPVEMAPAHPRVDSCPCLSDTNVPAQAST